MQRSPHERSSQGIHVVNSLPQECEENALWSKCVVMSALRFRSEHVEHTDVPDPLSLEEMSEVKVFDAIVHGVKVSALMTCSRPCDVRADFGSSSTWKEDAV